MNVIRKTDIEDIDRHWHNYRLFVWFLRLEKKYIFFKKRMFIEKNRTPFDLFTTINKTSLGSVFVHYCNTSNKVDKLWGSIFTYVPFVGFHWNEKDLNSNYMLNLTSKWVVFLDEHNYDKFKFI